MSDVAEGEVRTTENKKTTFRNREQASVRMKIKRFEDISENIKCVVGNDVLHIIANLCVRW